MLRRFELYRFAGDAGEDARSRLRAAFLESARRIPELVHSAVGSEVTVQPLAGEGLADAGVDLVWEHAFGTVEAYRRYMEHPFHACVLDRYLLADSPERVVADDRLGVGLAGYACESALFFLASGIRRLVFLELGPAGPGDLPATPPAGWDAVAPPEWGGVAPDVSVFVANTLASAWFDGETPIGPAPRWTHLLEQGFADARALAARTGAGASGEGVTRPGRSDQPTGVAAALAVTYRIQPGWGYGAP